MPGTHKQGGVAGGVPSPRGLTAVAVAPVLLHSVSGAVVLALVFVLLIAWWRAVKDTDTSPIEAIFEADFEAVLLMDPEGRIRRANRRFLDMADLSSGEIQGRPMLGFVTGWSRKRAVMAMRASGDGSRQVTEIGIATPNGHVDVRMTCGPELDRQKVIGVWAMLNDITEQKKAERELEDRALRDYLTGLPNRALFHDRLEHAVRRTRRGGGEVALLYLDLDKFKPVNDSAGHAVGDEVLREVAQRLVGIARAGDTVGRIGGDEFGVLLETAGTAEEAMGVAGRILAEMQAPMVVKGEKLDVGASVGVAMSGDDAREAEELVRRADMAMYEAKRRGGLQRHMYSSELEREPLHMGKRIEHDLRAALARDELYLQYQPIVDVTGQSFAGVEALVRWDHPEFGLLFPSVFIPVAERSALIAEVDRWVLARACREMCEIERQADLKLQPRLAVNLSARHFEEPDFVEAVSEILLDSDLDPERLQLEITESVAGGDRESVRRLKALGVRIAIDDFGTGYSSLAYLRDLDVDVLKVDRSFAISLGADPASAAIVRTILTLAELLQVEVIIEGIEEAAQLEKLRGLGGRYVQGFVFGRPVDAGELPNVLERGPVTRSAEHGLEEPVRQGGSLDAPRPPPYRASPGKRPTAERHLLPPSRT
ncbi:MAG: EAL domain-containing protein [Gemmatimonadota bacterium]|nr:EAL domain-containing protein [Gemmatimonadota bacterium]